MANLAQCNHKRHFPQSVWQLSVVHDCQFGRHPRSNCATDWVAANLHTIDHVTNIVLMLWPNCANFQLGFHLASTVIVGMDLSAVITWVGLGLSAVEPHALKFLCTCQLDLARVNEFRSIERFRTQDTRHRTTGYEPGHFADLTKSTWIEISNCRIIDTVSEEYRQTDSARVRTTRWPNRQRSRLRSLMVRTTRAGVWKSKYSWSRSRFSALSTV